MTQDINNNVLITASSHGLGLAIAKKFSENNHGVIIHGRNIDSIHHASKCIDNVVCTIRGDLRNPSTIEKIYNKVAEHNVHILVNNAAIPCYGLPMEQMSTEQVNHSLLTNLLAPIHLIHRIYPILIKNHSGGIININSIVGIEPKKYRSIHSAAKWGLRGLSKSLRIEANEKNIRVMNVYPTQIKTVDEHKYGLDPALVADLIYKEFYNPLALEELVIDGRPNEFKPDKKYEP